jgi:diadenosine tetraphosphatase ApaH/serine/threonine PP2A family protein phosphatase
MTGNCSTGPAEQMGLSDKAAFGELKNHHTAWLSTLETTAEVEDLLLCHGTPDSDNTYLLETVEPDGKVRIATPAEVKRRLDGTSARIVLCGHTHVPRIVALDDGRLVVNPGSVGLPAYTDETPVPHANQMGAPHARYAVLERRKATDPWQISFRVVAYDWNAAGKRAGRQGARGLGALDQDRIRQRMIPKSVQRFSDKIMRGQKS